MYTAERAGERRERICLPSTLEECLRGFIYRGARLFLGCIDTLAAAATAQKKRPPNLSALNTGEP